MELKLVLMVVFIAVSVFHLVTLFFKQTLIQSISKSLLMPTLLAMYIFSAQNIYWSIVAALVLGCAGDIFLLDIKNLLRFRLGLASFLLGHIAYIVAFISFAQPFNIIALAVCFATAIAFGIIMYKVVHPNREMRIPVVVYETVITAMAILAFQVYLNLGSLSGALIFAGSLCFLISDSVLARFTFVKQPKYGQFLVMLTYIAAQFCIVLGFCAL